MYSLSDLYYLVKFLPAYALPAGLPSAGLPSVINISSFNVDDNTGGPDPSDSPSSNNFPSPATSPTNAAKGGKQPNVTIPSMSSVLHRRERNGPTSPTLLPPPVSVGSPGNRGSFLPSFASPRSHRVSKEMERMVLPRQDETYLMPAYIPPKYGIFDLFPFSLLVAFLTDQGREVKGKKGARVRAQLRNQAVSHNLPLELSLYLVNLPSLFMSRRGY